MDFELIAIALGDVGWIAVAFLMGLLAKALGLPPLVGFLVAGFMLNLYGIAAGEIVRKLSDLGITLLLFIVGLKLNLRTFARPQVWGVAASHMSLVVLMFGTGIYVLALVGLPFLSGLDLHRCLLIAFALSFSSTVFVVKVLEEKGEGASLHGRIAIGILIVQDLAAVALLAVSTGKWPAVWAFLVLLVVPLRPLLLRVLERVGHGELLVLFGVMLALGGAQVFELVGLKGDLGALFLGVLMARHRKADELAKTMLGFKGSVPRRLLPVHSGLSGRLTAEAVLIGAAVTPFVFLKSALFFGLLAAFKLRSRTSFFASLKPDKLQRVRSYRRGRQRGERLDDETWLIAIAVALALSCTVAAGLSVVAQRIYARHRGLWVRLQRSKRLGDDQPIDMSRATVAVFGMGRIGTGHTIM